MYVFTNKRSKQLCEMIIVDAAYYANWLSEVYDLKDRMLEKLLVFSLKIEDLTFLTLICLSTEGKVKNSSHLFRKLRFAKIRHIGDYFADYGCKIINEFTDFLAYNWGGLRFWYSYFFLPSFSFTLMRVYMNTGIK